MDSKKYPEEAHGVSEIEMDDLYAVWQRLRQRNDWNLVEDETAFLTNAVAEFTMLSEETPRSQRLFVAVQRTYSILLYRGLWNRDEQATQELWLSLLRIALKRGWQQIDAEELAQEVIMRLIGRIIQLRAPQSLFTWAILILRTAERDKRKHNQVVSFSQSNNNSSELHIIDPLDFIGEVERRVISQKLQAMLSAKLSNELERLVLIRLVLFGDSPRDVAHDLDIPLHRTRIAKSRALKRLRQDVEFVQLLDDLVYGGG